MDSISRESIDGEGEGSRRALGVPAYGGGMQKQLQKWRQRVMPNAVESEADLENNPEDKSTFRGVMEAEAD